MVTADLAPEQLVFRSLTGVRQRVILIVLASVLALATQSSRGGLPSNGAEGDLDIAVEIGGERLRFACRGSGHATALFLASGETTALPLWDEARDGAAAFARVCTLDMTGVDMRASRLTPTEVEQIATDLDGVLAGEQVPAPYVLVALVDLEEITAHFAERSGGLVNGTLLIDPVPQPMIGWVVVEDEVRRQMTLETNDQFLFAIRSLVWPPARMHTP
jgi:hypothetical protein